MNAATKAALDFSSNIRTRLKIKGVAVIGATWVPGADGSFANGERAYQLDDNGTMKIRSFMQVLSIARGEGSR
jgi:hypothetical protein